MKNNHALRHRCPRCKKVRRFHDVPGDRGDPRATDAGWTLVDNVWVCGWCTDHEGTRRRAAEDRAYHREKRRKRRPTEKFQYLMRAYGPQDQHLQFHASTRFFEAREVIGGWPWPDEQLSMALDGAPVRIPIGEQVRTCPLPEHDALGENRLQGAAGPRRSGEGRLVTYYYGRGFQCWVEHGPGDAAWYDIAELEPVEVG